ncbi:MAG: tRNA (adenosine(37)-N6)-threonylcarbamoyltransferase complex ATPase subunit type 1 TsaE [Rikenella sp.]|nr:tRNA (adenosine(37)-N6)-threonylcarbamoyltransferase complex ATPase subunit type 1 TsaE [Rikenella sp.]
MKTITIKGVSDLPSAAEALLDEIRRRGATVVAFYGAMGAGKTTLIKEMCRQLGVGDLREVGSPSFAIVNVYDTSETAEPIYHFDFYRIKNVEEAYDFGYEEYFFSGNLCLVEWPEKIEELVPAEALRVRLTAADDEARMLEIIED